jgi:hypothetical protein
MECTLYDRNLAQKLTNGEIRFSQSNSGELDLSQSPSKVVKGYIFDAILHYSNLSTLGPDITLKLTFTIIDDHIPTTKIFTTPLRQSSISTKDSELFPILGINNPRVFRLSGMIDLTGQENSPPITRLTVEAFASWSIKKRDGAPDVGYIGCFVNSIEYPTTLTETGLLDINTRSLQNTDGASFGADMSIHCPDFLLNQRYVAESQIPSKHGAVEFFAYNAPSISKPEVKIWSTTVWGELYHHAPSPHLIKGHVYLEPDHGFSLTQFEVTYDDEIIKQRLLPTKDVSLTLSVIDLPWVDKVNYLFVPIDDITDYWQRSYKYKLSNNGDPDNPDDDKYEQHVEFLYKKYIFFDEKPLDNFYFSTYGQFHTKNVKDLHTTAIVTAGLDIHTDNTSISDFNLSIPYVAEVHLCNNPSRDIIFYNQSENFQIDIIELTQDTNYVEFLFPLHSYRFEGQFDKCQLYLRKIVNNGSKSVKYTWDPIEIVTGTDINGNSFGAMSELKFIRQLNVNFKKDQSYRFFCSNGVIRVRNRNVIEKNELFTFRYVPTHVVVAVVNDTNNTSENNFVSYQNNNINNVNNNLYQKTIQFKPRENTNVIFIIFLTTLCLLGLIIFIYILHYCGLFKCIHRKIAPQQEYNVSINLPYRDIK